MPGFAQTRYAAAVMSEPNVPSPESNDGARFALPPSDGARFALAERAYEAGDFARVRELCSELSASTDRALAARASQLAARFAPDPVAAYVLAASLVFFGVMLYVYAR